VDPVPGGLTTVADPDALLNRRTSGGVIGALRATVTPSPSVLLEASVARQWDRYSIEGATPLGRSAARFEDYVTGSIGGGYPYSQHDDHGRTSLMVRGTFTLGGHTVVAGAEYEDALVAFQFSKVGAGIGGQIIRSDTALYMADYQNYGGRFHNRSPAVYLQDSWRLTDRFTLNVGMRWSGQFFTSASGRVVQKIPDEWQPRAGFSWQVGRPGTQRVLGSYGRVYETLPEFLAATWFLDAPFIYRYYSSDPRQPGAVPYDVQDLTLTEAQGSVSVPGLHGDNFDEYTLGYERLLGAGTRLTVRGLYRHLRSAYLVAYDLSRDPWWQMGTPGQGTFDFLPAPRRDYTALEIAAEGAWRRVRYRMSYVLSRSWGNYTGGFSSDVAGSALQPGQNQAFMTPGQAVNSSGLLPNDRTHVAKVSAAYTFGFGLEAGAFLTAASGSPINAFAPGDFGVYTPTFVVPRGSAGRTPALWNVDFRMAYTLPFRRGPRSRVVLDVLHLGNPRRAVVVDELLAYKYYTIFGLGPADANPNYGKPTAYQAPMAARVGVEITF
jgi:hypothetical protein